MTLVQLKRMLKKALLTLGFAKMGSLFYRRGTNVSVLLNLQGSQFGGRLFINVGFVLHALSDAIPDRPEKSHMYFRLGRLCPRQRKLIDAVGDLDAQDHDAVVLAFLDVLAGDIANRLSALGHESALQEALANGELENGLILKEARQHLLGGR